jgi:hypothetical protein
MVRVAYNLEEHTISILRFLSVLRMETVCSSEKLLAYLPTYPNGHAMAQAVIRRSPTIEA